MTPGVEKDTRPHTYRESVGKGKFQKVGETFEAGVSCSLNWTVEGNRWNFCLFIFFLFEIFEEVYEEAKKHFYSTSPQKQNEFLQIRWQK